jgi:hypothetical protein
MNERGLRTTYAALSVAWAWAIFWASSQPNPFPFLPGGLLSSDKLLHAAAYAVLAGLAVGALARTRLGGLLAAAIAVLLAAAYGATDEWHQSFVPGRDADAADVAADAIGAVAGAGLGLLILRGRGARASIRA